MKDQRLVDRLTEYWKRLKGEQIMPEFERLQSDAIVDLWDRCIVLKTENKQGKKGGLYTYEHMGKEIIKAYGSNLEGHYVNVHMHNFPGWQVLKTVDELYDKPDVQHSMGSFVNDTDQVVKYRACILPFGRGEELTHALVGLSWKTFG